VENFLSFDEEQVFSMVAGSGDQHPKHVVDGKGGPALRAAAIYGPNASGKSNLVEAIRCARKLIVNGTRRSQKIPVRPFKLRAGSRERPSKFEFTFLSNNVLYNYGFRATASQIEQEWLYATSAKSEVKVFQRINSSEGKVTVDPGGTLSRGDGKQFVAFLERGTRPNQLFLTEAADKNVDSIMPVVDWFKNALTVISAEPKAGHLEVATYADSEFRDLLTSFLVGADTGVKGVETSATPVDLTSLFPDMAEGKREELETLVANMSKDEVVSITETPNDNVSYITSDARGRPIQIEMRFQHGGENDGSTFDIKEESDGTQRLIHIVPMVYMLKQESQATIIIDELDRRFHPHLTRMIVQTAIGACSTGSSNQLIFTTHDTNLLDLDLLRRDEIWFVEKNKAGASHVYSLAEFKIRPDLKVEKGYLNGRFGAIPFITPIDALGWNDDAETVTGSGSAIGQAPA